MLVDFAGLPGSGKTTVSQAIETELRVQGVAVQGLRNLAVTSLRDKRETVPFLKNRGERASLWGLCAFAQAHPVLYQTLHAASARDFNALIWSMEALAWLGIVAQLSDGGEIILNDEGFLQRGAMAFMQDDSGYAAFVAAIPAQVVTVRLCLAPEVALARIAGRKKGLTALVKGVSEAETLTQLARYDGLIAQGAAQAQAAGGHVIAVDATAPVTEVARYVVARLNAIRAQDAGVWRWSLTFQDRPRDKRRRGV